MEVSIFNLFTVWGCLRNHDRPNMVLGGFTPKQRLAMAAATSAWAQARAAGRPVWPSTSSGWGQGAMTSVFRELHRVLKPVRHVAFEVGEVHGGKTKLEEAVLPCGIAAGLEPVLIAINDQEFTKTANCWGVDNNAKGTNTNRIVVFQKR